MLDKSQIDQLRQVLTSEKERLVKNAQDVFRQGMEWERTVGRDSIDESMEEEILSTELRLRDREKYLLDKVNTSLERLDNGTIDECDDCGETISFKRLLARPSTNLCIDCKEEKEKDEQSRAQLVGKSGLEFSSVSGESNED